MANKKKYYTQNTETMTVTIDSKVKPTAAEEHIVKMLIAAGYKLAVKSEERSKEAKKRAAKETIKKASDMDMSKLTDAQQAELESILKGSGKGTGFFAARAFYKKCVNK